MDILTKKFEALKAEVIESLMKLVPDGKKGVVFVDFKDPDEVENEILEMPYHYFSDKHDEKTIKRFVYRVQKDIAINQVVFSFYDFDDSTTHFLQARQLPLELLITMEEITRNYTTPKVNA